jgi:hypothetical protein
MQETSMRWITIAALSAALLVTLPDALRAQGMSGRHDPQHHGGGGQSQGQAGGMMMGQGMTMMGGMGGMMGQGGMGGMMGHGGAGGMMGHGAGDDGDAAMPGMGMMGGMAADRPGGLLGGQARIRVLPVFELQARDVERHLTRAIERLGNPRLKLGAVAVDGDTIQADIVTLDGSLVQRFRIDRATGIGTPAP